MEQRLTNAEFITSATKEHYEKLVGLNFDLWNIVQEIREKREKVDGLERYDDIVAETLATASDLIDRVESLIERMPF